jgi:hypothetical protein
MMSLKRPVPGHQRLAGCLHLALAPYIARQRPGEIFMTPADLVHGPARIVEPDLLVLPFGGNEREPSELASALLLIEILRPSTAAPTASPSGGCTRKRVFRSTGSWMRSSG